jgi:hypothetical protein
MGDLNEARDFWSLVAKPAKYEDLYEGEYVMLEDHLRDPPQRRVIRVTAHRITDTGHHEIEFRNVEDGEQYDEPTVVLVAG